jgi:protein gp37
MATNSPIEWTDATWNPVTGCDKISPGCKHCYAERMAKRLKAARNPNYKNGFKLTLQPHMLARPLEWRKPKNIFVNSMSDLFHDDVPLEYIQRVFAVMNEATWHQYQILTKRAERVHELSRHLKWAPHIWMGVSVENAKYLDRIDHLRKTAAHVKFLSLEPLLGPLPKMNFAGSIGQSSAGNPVLARGLLILLGSPTSEISASRPAWPSSLSNGAGCRRRRLGASWKGGPGIKCPSLWSFPDVSFCCSLQTRFVRRLHRQSRSEKRTEGVTVGQSFRRRQRRDAGGSVGEVPRLAPRQS